MTEPMELEKPLDIKIQVKEKGTNTKPINTATHKDANPMEARISLDVEVQATEIPNALY